MAPLIRRRSRLYAAAAAPLGTEIPRLVLLAVLTAIALFATRALAGRERTAQQGDAAAWHARGQAALADNDLDAAIAAFRRATARDRTQRVYSASLGRALAADGQLAAASGVFLALREQTPDDGDVNLQLGRVFARQGDLTRAVRFYRSAVSAPWPDVANRLPVRLELASLLLERGLEDQALPELLAAAADAPPGADTQVRIGSMLLQAGDPGRALAIFRETLDQEPGDPRALAGAGSAAFALEQYTTALRYLRQAPDEPGVRDQRELAALVINRDPLAARLALSERRRRNAANLDAVAARLNECASRNLAPDASAQLEDAQARVKAAQAAARRADRDTIEQNLDLIATLEQVRARSCGEANQLERALGLIVELHNEAS